MTRDVDTITLAESDEGVVLGLPDGSSIDLDVPQTTIRRSAVLQEAIFASGMATNTFITLPQGVLQDWLQSFDALKGATTSPWKGTDISRDPRLLRFLNVRCFSVFLWGAWHCEDMCRLS